MKAVVYDSGEDRQSWVLGWFHQVYNKSIGNGSHYVVLVGQERTKAIYVPSYEMARFLKVFSMCILLTAACRKITGRRIIISDLRRGAYLEERRSFAVWMWLC